MPDRGSGIRNRMSEIWTSMFDFWELAKLVKNLLGTKILLIVRNATNGRRDYEKGSSFRKSYSSRVMAPTGQFSAAASQQPA